MSAAPTTPSVEQAIRFVLSKNFDADSKVCLLTLLKIIDNVLQKPGNDKVRSLRTGNATIQSKIINKHGHHVLMACGFVHEPADLKWNQEEKLVLKPETEDTATLVKARHTVARIATVELGLKAGEIPPYKAPPQGIQSSKPASSTANSSGFDVYKGSRFDGQSAAVGTNLGAPENWKSKTEQELAKLKQREAKLQTKLGNNKSANKSGSAPPVDRQWTVFVPGQKQPPSSQSAPSPSIAAATSSARGDGALLATHFQQQQANRLAAENRGFTTKAMRDLEKLKKQKVYSHTQLAIHFPDGISIKANFSTKEKLKAVLEGLSNDVLFSTETLPLPSFELYQTPPRRVLDPTQTLQSLGLVPAAKVYVSWKKPLPKSHLGAGSGLGVSWYIQPHLLGQSSGPALPTSVPVLQSSSNAATSSAAGAVSAKPAAKRKKTKAEKEAALMKRMLGK